jgi:hypothetical protein
MHYEDGTHSPSIEVLVTEGFEPVRVTIPSIDNGVVATLEIEDEEGQVVCRNIVDLYLRVVDALEVTVIPPLTGWPAQAFFTKQVDEAAAAAMRDRLQVMARRLHNRQEQMLFKDPRSSEWVRRGAENQPTGDYL